MVTSKAPFISMPRRKGQAITARQNRRTTVQRVVGGYGGFFAVKVQNEVDRHYIVRAIFSLVGRQKAFYR